MAQIKITLIRGLVARKPNQVKTCKALGLTKRNSFVVKEDSEAIKGMVKTVAHLVKVESV
jgi:large subunit ribosomal protein L30